MRTYRRTFIVFMSAAALLCCKSRMLAASPAAQEDESGRAHFVTTVVQFRNLSGVDYLVGCDFRLEGVVTLVDTNRDLVVLQDATGAVAINAPLEDSSLEVGQRVTLEGTRCHPYFEIYPNYPCRPSGREIRFSFEGPENWGEYHLTRMRGYLNPPVTGEYSFWIASDNSSELWLSEDMDPSKARKIAFILRYGWTAPHEWSRFPSQYSGPVSLKAGQAYYIEALCEQSRGQEHLSVAWKGPGLQRSVIQSAHLTPWGQAGSGTHGILREFWTNYPDGDLDGLAGPRQFKSALTVEKVRITSAGPGQLPVPERIPLYKPLLPEDNYRWVQVEGLVRFVATYNHLASIELSDGQTTVEVRVPDWHPETSSRLRNARVRVEGVCEGVYDQKEALVPGLIWASTESSITFIQNVTTNADGSAPESPTQAVSADDPAVQGFYGMRGVVTFNDRVFDIPYTFVEANAAIVLVNPTNPDLRRQMKAGHWVDLGGALRQGKYMPSIRALVVKDLGWHPMPSPLAEPLSLPASMNREGRWSELEGVVHSVNTNGTLSIVGKNGSAYLWIGQSSSNDPSRCVDVRLRARGVLTSTLLDAPVLLVPSPKFVDVEGAPPEDPFDIPCRAIADVVPEKMGSSWFHRVRILGEVTYRDTRSFLVQDATGAIRVLTADPPAVEEGQAVAVLAFPSRDGYGRALTGPVLRPARLLERVEARNLDVSEALSSERSGTLVSVNATLLGRKTNDTGCLLELQEQQRVFAASLSTGRGDLPEMVPGSRLRITGVCNDETPDASLADEKLPERKFLPSLNVLLRSPKDVAVLSSPSSWWTLRRTVSVVGTLLAVILVILLWVYLLRRRLEHQRAIQVAFSRRVLERLEDERRRIAINLHDSLGQILLVIKNHALLAFQGPPEVHELQKQLGEISGAASQAIEEVRQITHGLRPYQLDRLGLTQAIRASISQTTTNNSISFATRVDDIDGVFDKDAEIHLYRIVQEAVTNVVKHSTATEATVAIIKRTAAVSLSIRDNGQGFDLAKLSSHPYDLGYGLTGIAERVRILGGILVIDSRPGEGSSLTVEIPVPNSDHDTRDNHIDRR